MPKGKRPSPEQIAAALRKQEGGMKVSEICRPHSISEQTSGLVSWQRTHTTGKSAKHGFQERSVFGTEDWFIVLACLDRLMAVTARHGANL